MGQRDIQTDRRTDGQTDRSQRCLMLDAFPWLRHLPHKPLEKMKVARETLDSFVNDELDKVKVGFVYGFICKQINIIHK